MRRPLPRSPRPGFTLVEILVTIVIIGVLIALLLPVVAGAVRTARNAQVGAEQQVLAQALASFKNKYGDYPPSRILLSESGFYPVTDSTPLAVTNGADLTVGQLAARSVAFLRKFFPRAQFSTSGPLYSSKTGWHDFDGDQKFWPPSTVTNFPQSNYYILDGRQCLTFFLGGIPSTDQNTGAISMTGFGKNPANPFQGNAYTKSNPLVTTSSRDAPFAEFDSGRLTVPADILTPPSGFPVVLSPLIPGYVDRLGSTDSTGKSNGYYAYFSAYGGNSYDPNDVNVNEEDANSVSPVMTYFDVAFPVFSTAGTQSQDTNGFNYAKSPSPNPYLSSQSISTNGAVNAYNPNSYQIISPGADGTYGPGGQYLSSGASELLPLDTTNSPYNSTDASLRFSERDNITNFHNGKLE